MPTASEKNIDVDVIICAGWKLLTEEFPGRYIVIATTNVLHLSRFLGIAVLTLMRYTNLSTFLLQESLLPVASNLEFCTSPI